MYRFVAALVGFLGLQLSAVSGFTLPVRARNMRTAVGAADDTNGLHKEHKIMELLLEHETRAGQVAREINERKAVTQWWWFGYEDTQRGHWSDISWEHDLDQAAVGYLHEAEELTNTYRRVRDVPTITARLRKQESEAEKAWEAEVDGNNKIAGSVHRKTAIRCHELSGKIQWIAGEGSFMRAPYSS